jgi:hypothetical protein
MVAARRFFGSSSGVSQYVIDKRLGETGNHYGGRGDYAYLHTMVNRYRQWRKTKAT